MLKTTTSVVNASQITGTLTTGNGGTGQSTWTAGDVPYYASGSTLSKLPIGAANRVLTSSGSAPQWSQDISVGVATAASKFIFSGAGSTPGASELGMGTNGAGSRTVFNAPTGGEHDFAINGNVCVAMNASLVVPIPDNTLDLGVGALRWKEVYAVAPIINTSDYRSKQQVRDLSVSERAVAKKIKGLVKAFKFNDAVESKGDGARIHVGVIAQEVALAFKSEGLDPHQYSLFCHDAWDDKFDDIYESQQITHDDGTVEMVSVKVGERQIVKAGDRFGIRYCELLAFVIAAL